jgi:hypothetical protein
MTKDKSKSLAIHENNGLARVERSIALTNKLLSKIDDTNVKYSDINEIQKLPKSIDANFAEKSIEKMQIYGGHSAYIKIYYYDGIILETINTLGYVMFRTPETYGHWGFVIKGTEDEIAILIKVDERCEIQLYDQKIRQTIKEGDLVQIDLEWTSYKQEKETSFSKRTILNGNEFKFL